MHELSEFFSDMALLVFIIFVAGYILSGHIDEIPCPKKRVWLPIIWMLIILSHLYKC